MTNAFSNVNLLYQAKKVKLKSEIIGRLIKEDRKFLKSFDFTFSQKIKLTAF